MSRRERWAIAVVMVVAALLAGAVSFFFDGPGVYAAAILIGFVAGIVGALVTPRGTKTPPVHWRGP